MVAVAIGVWGRSKIRALGEAVLGQALDRTAGSLGRDAFLDKRHANVVEDGLDD